MINEITDFCCVGTFTLSNRARESMDHFNSSVFQSMKDPKTHDGVPVPDTGGGQRRQTTSKMIRQIISKAWCPPIGNRGGVASSSTTPSDLVGGMEDLLALFRQVSDHVINKDCATCDYLRLFKPDNFAFLMSYAPEAGERFARVEWFACWEYYGILTLPPYSHHSRWQRIGPKEAGAGLAHGPLPHAPAATVPG